MTRREKREAGMGEGVGGWALLCENSLWLSHGWIPGLAPKVAFIGVWLSVALCFPN